MYFSSRLVMSEKNIEAAEEYLKKSEAFHRLWIPDEEIKDVRKILLMHKDAKSRGEA